jgi:hypothetical protein
VVETASRDASLQKVRDREDALASTRRASCGLPGLIGGLTEAAAFDTRGLEIEEGVQTRTVAILTVTLAIAVSLSADPLAAQPSPTPTCTPNLFIVPQASHRHEVANEVYAPSVTAAIYLVNFLLLYMAGASGSKNANDFWPVILERYHIRRKSQRFRGSDSLGNHL